GSSVWGVSGGLVDRLSRRIVNPPPQLQSWCGAARMQTSESRVPEQMTGNVDRYQSFEGRSIEGGEPANISVRLIDPPVVCLAIPFRATSVPKPFCLDVSPVSSDTSYHSAGQIASFEMNAPIASGDSRLVGRVSERPPSQRYWRTRSDSGLDL